VTPKLLSVQECPIVVGCILHPSPKSTITTALPCVLQSSEDCKDWGFENSDWLQLTLSCWITMVRWENKKYFNPGCSHNYGSRLDVRKKHSCKYPNINEKNVYATLPDIFQDWSRLIDCWIYTRFRSRECHVRSYFWWRAISGLNDSTRYWSYSPHLAHDRDERRFQLVFIKTLQYHT